MWPKSTDWRAGKHGKHHSDIWAKSDDKKERKQTETIPDGKEIPGECQWKG